MGPVLSIVIALLPAALEGVQGAAGAGEDAKTEKEAQQLKKKEDMQERSEDRKEALQESSAESLQKANEGLSDVEQGQKVNWDGF